MPRSRSEARAARMTSYWVVTWIEISLQRLGMHTVLARIIWIQVSQQIKKFEKSKMRVSAAAAGTLERGHGPGLRKADRVNSTVTSS